MKIKGFKRKCIILSLIFLLSGALISTVGFGVIGFNYNNFKKIAEAEAWYQTIHVNSYDNLWYGIKLGDNISLIGIGYTD